MQLAEEQWQRFLKVFGPLQEKLVKESQMPAREQVGFQRMAGGINERYGDSAANLRRTMAGRYETGSPMERSSQRSLDLMRTKDLAGAEADANAKRFSNMFQTASMGQGLPSTAMQGMQGAAGTYGNLANMYGNMAGQSFGSAGSALGNIYQMYNLNKMFGNDAGGWGGGEGNSMSGGGSFDPGGSAYNYLNNRDNWN
jgi:hypothetical protein